MDDVLTRIMAVLLSKHPTMTIDMEFQEVGADSQTLLDIIMEVEDNTGRRFDPDAFDLNSAITPMKLSNAFKAIQ